MYYSYSIFSFHDNYSYIYINLIIRYTKLNIFVNINYNNYEP